MSAPPRYRRVILLIWVLLCSLGVLARASLVGPWRRYTSRTLGFQIPAVADWWVSQSPGVAIFGLQEAPETPVRLSVGRIQAGGDNFETSIQAIIAHSHEDKFSQVRCEVDDRPAIRVDGETPQGPVREYYVNQGPYWYWISFRAPTKDHWDRYAKSFDIIMSEFRFL